MPQLHLRWAGFRRNHRQVCRRIAQRRVALGLPDLDAYRTMLETTPDEWRVLDGLCRVTISRFGRDRAMWSALVEKVLPHFTSLRAWCAGCGAGEEPFTLAIAARTIPLEIVATDIDDEQLARAKTARFPDGALAELPADWRALAFDGDELRAEFRAPVHFSHHDVRTEPPAGPFDLIACRNLAFSYFDEVQQREVAARFRGLLSDERSVLLAGLDENVPDFVEIAPCIWRPA